DTLQEQQEASDALPQWLPSLQTMSQNTEEVAPEENSGRDETGQQRSLTEYEKLSVTNDAPGALLDVEEPSVDSKHQTVSMKAKDENGPSKDQLTNEEAG
ncbi:MAG TPA: hypothetical protein VKR42_02780, partial [Ktedonobacteraceae bacterium]|nr:hypothetical protein [Ktedonobacteraceae bacterium]